MLKANRMKIILPPQTYVHTHVLTNFKESSANVVPFQQEVTARTGLGSASSPDSLVSNSEFKHPSLTAPGPPPPPTTGTTLIGLRTWTEVCAEAGVKLEGRWDRGDR